VASQPRPCYPAAIGRLAQPVEHLVYTERVGGSNPSPPTIPTPDADAECQTGSRMLGMDFDRIVDLVGRSNATIMDIGANDGEHSAEFARRFPYGQVFSFEPDPRAARKFLSRVTDPRILLTQKAVGQETGQITFFQSSGRPPGMSDDQYSAQWSDGWDLSGSIRRPTGHLDAHPWCTFDTTIEVEVTTLDTWADEHRVRLVDFIWADVQRAEVDLIKGGLRTLRQTRFLYTEFSNDELYEGEIGLEGIKGLLPWFEVVDVFPTDVLLRNREMEI
jgi:FkbM family methyltransferase